MSSVPALPPEPDSIRLNVKSTVRLYTNATLQLEVAMSPACSETTLTWKSSNRRVAVVDDLLATGGTALACAKLCEKAGGVVAACCFAIELTDLPGRDTLKEYEVGTILKY